MHNETPQGSLGPNAPTNWNNPCIAVSITKEGAKIQRFIVQGRLVCLDNTPAASEAAKTGDEEHKKQQHVPSFDSENFLAMLNLNQALSATLEQH